MVGIDNYPDKETPPDEWRRTNEVARRYEPAPTAVEVVVSPVEVGVAVRVDVREVDVAVRINPRRICIQHRLYHHSLNTLRVVSYSES